MGTRADFYVGRGEKAEWLGSVAYDGYPDGGPEELAKAKSLSGFRERVDQLLAREEHATRPAEGWPWPWEDSQTTDYAYAFENGQVWVSNYGHAWFKADEPQPEAEGDEVAVFPRMGAASAERIAETFATGKAGALLLKF